MKIEQIDMTPALAAKLLANNPMNRLPSPRRVNALADAIDRGAWLCDGNPVKVAEDGTLIDGQHRLMAIAKTGKTVPAVLITGMKPEARLSTDTNRPRSLADFLRMNGVASASDHAAVTRFYWYWKMGDLDRRIVGDIALLWEFYQEHQEVIGEAVARAKSTYHRVLMQRSVMAVAWIILSEIDGEDAKEFWAQIIGDAARSPAVDALTAFGRTRQLSAGHYEQRYGLAIVIKAWNAFRKGAPVTVLAWRAGGGERFPDPS